MIGLQLGQALVDLENPGVIDYAAVQQRLRAIRRFSSDPNALTVYQHGRLTRILFRMTQAARPGVYQNADVIADWCSHHDDHEALIGDIPSPVKEFFEDQCVGFTRALTALEMNIDRALHRTANEIGETYLVPWELPLVEQTPVYQNVGFCDRLAATFEWRFVLGFNPQPWNVRILPEIDDAKFFILREVYREGDLM